MGESSRVRPSARAIFRSVGRAGREVRHGRGHDERVGPPAVRRPSRRCSARPQLGGRLDANDRRAVRQCRPRPRGDQGHGGPARQRRLGDRDAHLPGRAVADVADRVDRLARAAGGDDDLAADEVGLARRRSASGGRAAGFGWRTGRSGDRRDDGVDDRGQLGQPADAGLARRERAGLRRHDRVAEGVAEARDVRDRRRVGPHVAVHRGRHDDRRAGARHAAVTTSPASPFAIAAEPVRRRRRDDDGVRRVGDDDVADPAVRQEVEHVASRRGGARAPRTTAARRIALRRGESSTTTSAPSAVRSRSSSTAL